MAFHFEKSEEKGIVILRLQGQLDASQVMSFKKDYANFIQREKPFLVLECSALEFVDSTGLGCLISLLRKVESKSGKLAFTALSAEVASIFEITRLHKLFNIYPNMPSAIESLSQ